MPAEEDVKKTLKQVNDPEIGINIIDLGLIYKIEISGSLVKLDMTMTTPFCPYAPKLISDTQSAIEKMEGVTKCEINLVWSPPWSESMISEEARLELGRA